MSALDDVASDLFAAIEAVDDAPDLETQGPTAIAGFGVSLQLAKAMLDTACDRWNANARVALPDWEHPHEATDGH